MPTDKEIIIVTLLTNYIVHTPFSEGVLFYPTSSALPGTSHDKMILRNIHQNAPLDAKKFQEKNSKKPFYFLCIFATCQMMGLCHRSATQTV